MRVCYYRLPEADVRKTAGRHDVNGVELKMLRVVGLSGTASRHHRRVAGDSATRAQMEHRQSRRRAKITHRRGSTSGSRKPKFPRDFSVSRRCGARAGAAGVEHGGHGVGYGTLLLGASGLPTGVHHRYSLSSHAGLGHLDFRSAHGGCGLVVKRPRAVKVRRFLGVAARAMWARLRYDAELDSA